MKNLLLFSVSLWKSVLFLLCFFKAVRFQAGYSVFVFTLSASTSFVMLDSLWSTRLLQPDLHLQVCFQLWCFPSDRWIPLKRTITSLLFIFPLCSLFVFLTIFWYWHFHLSARGGSRGAKNIKIEGLGIWGCCMSWAGNGAGRLDLLLRWLETLLGYGSMVGIRQLILFFLWSMNCAWRSAGRQTVTMARCTDQTHVNFKVQKER